VKYKVKHVFFKIFSGSLGSRPARTALRTDTLNGSNDAVWRKEVPFGSRIDTVRQFWGFLSPKTPKIWPQR
jgi:hypothetical protein